MKKISRQESRNKISELNISRMKRRQTINKNPES